MDLLAEIERLRAENLKEEHAKIMAQHACVDLEEKLAVAVEALQYLREEMLHTAHGRTVADEALSKIRGSDV